jgi:hypothetical protein
MSHLGMAATRISHLWGWGVPAITTGGSTRPGCDHVTQGFSAAHYAVGMRVCAAGGCDHVTLLGSPAAHYGVGYYSMKVCAAGGAITSPFSFPAAQCAVR